MRHALAYVAGFGAVFTLLGITATFAAGPLVDYLPAAAHHRRRRPDRARASTSPGILRIPALERTWRPLDAGRGGLAGDRDRLDRASGPAARRRRVGDRLGGRIVSARGGWLASFGLGAIFAIGWTPCIGIILGGDPDAWPRRRRRSLQGTLLLVAYTLGLGLPFLLIAAVYDRAPRLLAPLVRHGRTVVADRRPARRVHRRRDGLRLARRSCRATSTSTRRSE